MKLEVELTDILFCLMTTLERIFLVEVTIAAQVSSAEDSRARTLNSLASTLVARHAIRSFDSERACDQALLLTVTSLMMWNPSHLHSPRRSHEQSHIDLKTSRSSSPDDGPEPRRRTSSDATPRQTPASTRFLNASSDQDTSRNFLPSSSLFPEKPEVSGSSRRLGFFADKLTSSLSGTAKDTSASLKNSLHPSLLLHPHSHSRAESGSTTSSVLSPPAMSTSSNLPTPKSHTSPSKVSLLGLLDSFWNHS